MPASEYGTDSPNVDRTRKTLAESRGGIVTTAAPYQPDKGDQGPQAPYRMDVKFREAYAAPLEPAPDLRISHLAYDRKHTVPADLNAYFPLAQARQAVQEGRIGSLSPRFYGVPTTYSQRATISRDAPFILNECRRDGVEIAVLPAV